MPRWRVLGGRRRVEASIAAWGIDYEKVNRGNELNDKTSTLAF